MLLGFGSALLTQRFFVRLYKRLLGQTFLYSNSTSDRFIRTRKGTQRVPFVLLVLFAYANNLSLLVQTITSSNLLELLPHKQRNLQNQKSTYSGAFGFLVLLCLRKDFSFACANDYLVKPSCTATAQATEAPTIGLLPIPIRPIISTCAGTDEEPANCASECILPIVSVIP